MNLLNQPDSFISEIYRDGRRDLKHSYDKLEDGFIRNRQVDDIERGFAYMNELHARLDIQAARDNVARSLSRLRIPEKLV